MRTSVKDLLTVIRSKTYFTLKFTLKWSSLHGRPVKILSRTKGLLEVLLIYYSFTTPNCHTCIFVLSLLLPIYIFPQTCHSLTPPFCCCPSSCCHIRLCFHYRHVALLMPSFRFVNTNTCTRTFIGFPQRVHFLFIPIKRWKAVYDYLNESHERCCHSSRPTTKCLFFRLYLYFAAGNVRE